MRAGLPALLAACGNVHVAHARNEASWVLFGSLDAGQHAAFNSSGFKRSLTGKLDEPGLFVMVTTGNGIYRYRSEGAPFGHVQGHATQASLMIGGQWQAGSSTLGFFMGPDYDRQELSPADPGNPARGTHIGLKMQAEIWSRPTDNVLATATLIGSSNGHVWARAAAGWRLWGDVFLGPEATAYVEGSYQEARLGLHLTGIEAFGFHLRVAGGWLKSDHNRPGAYAGLSTYYRY